MAMRLRTSTIQFAQYQPVRLTLPDEGAHISALLDGKPFPLSNPPNPSSHPVEYLRYREF